ncbi:hypothetical protein FKM82_024558 [Ascaphus truei]
MVEDNRACSPWWNLKEGHFLQGIGFRSALSHSHHRGGALIFAPNPDRMLRHLSVQACSQQHVRSPDLAGDAILLGRHRLGGTLLRGPRA